MKKKLMFGLLIMIVAVLPLLTACPVEQTPTPTPSTPTPASPTPTPETHWWDALGEPQYGGTITQRAAFMFSTFDPYLPSPPGSPQYQYESLHATDWTKDRAEWDFKTMFVPLDDNMGALAESWEMQDPQTIVFHIRKGVHWQDIEPANGREFTAFDAEYHYHRLLGIGSGYDKPSPVAGWLNQYDDVTATDNYTLVVKLKSPSVLALYQVFDPANIHFIECPEAVEQGVSNDWHRAAGTGPWILADFVDGSMVTYSKNPNYWGHDERYPANQLPYVDTLKFVIIPDTATALAALRTGAVDMIADVDFRQATVLADSNPELLQAEMPADGPGIDLRVDVTPFTDIRVRKALQMAVDRPTIAQTYYGGVVDGQPTGLLSPSIKGFAFAYQDWPQELKDEYSYQPEKARALLAEAGYPNGFETEVVAPSNTDLELLQIIKAQLTDIGVDMEIKVMDPTSAMAVSRAVQYEQMYYGSAGSACGQTRTPQNVILTGYSKDREMNTCNINDPGYDAIYNTFADATTEAAAAQAMREADQYALEHHWRIYAFPIARYNIYQPRIKGYAGERLSFVDRFLFARWWIEQ